MNTQTPHTIQTLAHTTPRRYNGIPVRVWGWLAAFALLVLAGIEVREGAHLLEAGGYEPFIFRLAGYANLLLVGAAVLYTAHLWLKSPLVGRLASGVAATGAATALVALAVRWFETYYLQRPGHVPLNVLYEVMALFNALTVVAYLIIERVYRSRSAGAFVMLIVLAAVLFQIWLLSHDHDTSVAAGATLRHYAVHAHVLGSFIAYAAFAGAAAMAAACLLHTLTPLQRARLGLTPFARAERRLYERMMWQSVVLGLAAFSLAILVGVLEAHARSGVYWAWGGKEWWALAVWAAYAGCVALQRWLGWSATRLAWCVLFAFALSLASLLTAQWLGSDTHAFAYLI